MESVKGPGACGFIDASAAALQGFTCSSHLGQEALHACSGGGQASACLLTGRTHKYLDVQMLLSLSERLQVDDGQDANMVALRLVAFACEYPLIHPEAVTVSAASGGFCKCISVSWVFKFRKTSLSLVFCKCQDADFFPGQKQDDDQRQLIGESLLMMEL